MRFSSILLVLSTLTFSTALPVFQSRSTAGLFVREGNSTSALFGNSTSSAVSASSASSGTAKPTTTTNLADLNEDPAKTKAVFGAVKGSPQHNMTDPFQISALAGQAFNAESNEDSQRAVLFAAAGNAGASANSKIVQNTPTVLNGLKAMMTAPSVFSVKANVASIQAARNPNILPSITQLSNAALGAMGLPPTAQKFPATGTR
ncbi:hypothetical protein EYC84_000568 [Monilinia fructicola]|uniref:Ppe family protein n=1 Tax=Monilinia fructicola TaxID=38448 RepID=A0A5M9JWS2_MONFR|nr:hypothetical protein EYC84_000568 [Monilinia fructicola]